MEFGKRLVIIRENEGFSQFDFAEKLNIAAQSLARYEKNKVKPSFEFVAKLINMFNKYNAHWILTGTGEMIINVNIDNPIEQTIENLKQLPTKKQEYFYHAIKAELLKEEIECKS